MEEIDFAVPPSVAVEEGFSDMLCNKVRALFTLLGSAASGEVALE